MFESFHSHDNLPMDKLLLNMSHKDEQTLDAQIFNNLAGILSGPVALFSSRAART
jgi:hypothetical protein